MKMKKTLALVLTAAMCIGTFAVMPTSTYAADGEKTFELNYDYSLTQIMEPEEYMTFYVTGYAASDDDCEWIAPEIVDYELDGEDCVTVMDVVEGSVTCEAFAEGPAVLKIYYELPEEYADYEDENDGCLTISILVVPFCGYFEMDTSRPCGEALPGEQVSFNVVAEYLEGAETSDFTYSWSIVDDDWEVVDAKDATLTVDPADPMACTFSATSLYTTYYVLCDIYYQGYKIDSLNLFMWITEEYYTMELIGYDEEMEEGESCTVTPVVYHYDTSHRNGVKISIDTEYIKFDCFGCEVTENSNGTYTIYQSDGWSYVDFSYNYLDEDDDIFIMTWCNNESYFYDEYEDYYIRLYGRNRYETAAETAEELWCNVPGYFSNIVIASGTNFPDALAGCPLASQLNAPILLAGTGTCKNSNGKTVSVNSYAYEEIDYIAEDDAVIWILGGTSAVPQEVEDYLTEAGYTVNRLSGNDRYETDMQIIDAMDIEEGTSVVVVRGYTSYKTSADAKAKKNPQGYADSLSISGIAGAYGMPIFLADKNGLNEEQLDKIAEINPDTVYVIGGESAVSSDAEKVLADEFGEDAIVRIAGTDRYDTSVKVAEAFETDVDSECAVLACGTNFPDGLTGGVLASYLNVPVLLVDPIEKKNAEAEEFAANSNFQGFYVCGGPSAVATLTVDNFAKQIMDHSEGFRYN